MSTNPIEQVWEDDGEGNVWNKGRLADLVHVPTVGHAQSAEEVHARGRIISAAPDMARALKELFGEAEHLSTCHALRDHRRPCRPDCAQARGALRKAGGL